MRPQRSEGVTRAPGRLDDDQQQQHAERDAGVGEVERRPAQRELDEVRHRAHAQPVDDVAERPTEQHPRWQPDQGLVTVTREVDEQYEQGGADEHGHHDVTTGQEAESHALVTGVDELYAGQHASRFARNDRFAHGGL